METKPQANMKKAPTFPFYGWLILLGLLAWSLWSIWPHQPSVVEMPYSTFLNQVLAGNVSQVTFIGNDINGMLVNALPVDSTQAGGQAAALSTTFHTHLPEVAGVSNLIGLLMSHNVQINAEPSSLPWLGALLTSRLPLFLLAITVIYGLAKISRDRLAAASFFRRNRRIYAIEHPEVTFNDVAGEDEAVSQLRAMADRLRGLEDNPAPGVSIPKGILMVGQPGTGKMQMARALAGESKTPLFYLNALDLAKNPSGTGPNQIHDLFQQARKAAPSIIFIDALDALGHPDDTGSEHDQAESERTFNQLEVEMETPNERHPVLILAATHYPDRLEPALLKTGCFDHQIMVSLPDRAGREGILKIHTRKLRLSKNVNLGIIARSTTGLSGADLANLCQEASQAAARKDHDQVSMADFEEALDRILLTAPRQLLSDHERRVAAYHEAGHVLVAWLTAPADPIYSASIIPHLQATTCPNGRLLEDSHDSHSKSYLLARLAVLLGGRGAEEVGVGEVTTRSEDDLAEATRLAHSMVTRWGMGHIGPITLERQNGQHATGPEPVQSRGYSEETAAQIDQDMQSLLKTSYANVCQLLNTSRGQLDHLVEALLNDETINQEGLARILGPRPYPNSSDINPPVDVSDLDQQPSRGS